MQSTDKGQSDSEASVWFSNTHSCCPSYKQCGCQVQHPEYLVSLCLSLVGSFFHLSFLSHYIYSLTFYDFYFLPYRLFPALLTFFFSYFYSSFLPFLSLLSTFPFFLLSFFPSPSFQFFPSFSIFASHFLSFLYLPIFDSFLSACIMFYASFLCFSLPTVSEKLCWQWYDSKRDIE